jgi:hypothetical protein
MRIKTLLLTVVTAGLLIGGGIASSQHQHEEGAKGQGPQGMMGGGAMMGDGMMNMMQGCERMMRTRGHTMPELPPGNEKLQLQMHAEMMQKVGEILSKYAAQVK